jgi:hypothetical protein
MSARTRETLIPVGPVLAGIGAVLLIVSLFLSWYEGPPGDGISGFTVFEFVDLLLTGLAIVMLVSLADAIGLIRSGLRPGIPVVAAALALIIVLTQVVNDPPAVAARQGNDPDIGIWLGLGGAALMMAGAVLSTARIAIAVEPRERGGARVVAGGDEPAPRRATGPDETPTVADEPPPPPRP